MGYRLLWFVILIIALIIRCTNCNLPISLLRMYIISLIITYTKKGDALQFSILHCATEHFAVFLRSLPSIYFTYHGEHIYSYFFG